MRKRLIISGILSVAIMSFSLYAASSYLESKGKSAYKRIENVATDAPSAITQITMQEIEKSVSVIEISQKEKELMARLAMAEAEDEGLKGKALVMNVAWNRVHADGFENTVESVIYEPNQFAVINNGRFDRVIPDKECYEALDLFLSGWDGSSGALYFESKSASKWHQDNLQFLFQYRNHYFYTEKELDAD